MAIILDCLHILGIFFPVKHTLSIVCKCVVAVEVANYNMRHVSASKWWEQELFSWWFVHGMYHYTW